MLKRQDFSLWSKWHIRRIWLFTNSSWLIWETLGRLYHSKLRILVHLSLRDVLNCGIGDMFKLPLGDVKDFHHSLAQTWFACARFNRLSFRKIAAIATCSGEVAPGQATTPLLHKTVNDARYPKPPLGANQSHVLWAWILYYIADLHSFEGYHSLHNNSIRRSALRVN